MPEEEQTAQQVRAVAEEAQEVLLAAEQAVVEAERKARRVEREALQVWAAAEEAQEVLLAAEQAVVEGERKARMVEPAWGLWDPMHQDLMVRWVQAARAAQAVEREALQVRAAVVEEAQEVSPEAGQAVVEAERKARRE